MPDPDEDTPVLLLITLVERHLAEALQSHLVAAGFDDHRVVHHNVMAHVTFEGIRLTELAEKAGITKQAMSELVIDLEQLGYLVRTADPHDRRAKLISFTDKGRAAVREAMRAFAKMESALGERSLSSLRRSLLTILATPFTSADHPAGGSASDRRA
ncbi:MAG: MarR family transcriptional regulator [Acidimicrobiales bacterium]|nr:MarR family transcriptional regulator [Acidimicrobiales bacterium]